MAGQPKKAPEHLATPPGSCMYCHVMPLKPRITCHRGDSTPNTQSDLILQLAVLSHNNIISYLFTEMLFHMSLYHSSCTKAYNILIMSLLTPLKKLFHHSNHRGSQRQKTLLLLEIFTIIHHPSHRGP